MATALRVGTVQEQLYIWLRQYPGWHDSPQMARALRQPERRSNFTRALDALSAKSLIERRITDGDPRWHRRVSEYRYVTPPDDVATTPALRRTCRYCGMRSRNIARHIKIEHPEVRP